jgi:hypothetical protein
MNEAFSSLNDYQIHITMNCKTRQWWVHLCLLYKTEIVWKHQVL